VLSRSIRVPGERVRAFPRSALGAIRTRNLHHLKVTPLPLGYEGRIKMLVLVVGLVGGVLGVGGLGGERLLFGHDTHRVLALSGDQRV
jgi:hypothetical protein